MISSYFKARGVAILINKNTPVTIGETVTLGRYVLVNGQIYSEPGLSGNFYAPNYDDESFVQDILKVAGGRQNILIGGDFNFCLDPVLDK